MPVEPGKPVTNANLEGIGSGFVERVTYTASTTFSKSSYPTGTRARVICQAAGGGGGGAQAAGANQTSAGGGGEGGGYAESFIDFDDMASSVTVTVGAGGTAGGTAGTGSAGTGGTSSFGTHVSATGGQGGTNGGVGTAPSTFFFFQGGSSTQTLTGAITHPGQPGNYGLRVGGLSTTQYASGQQSGGHGGSSRMGSGGAGGVNAAGETGRGYGGGGGGSSTAVSTAARSGSVGGPGAVILEIYS